MIITIDGPVASGKSTLARDIADELGFYYLNSGLLYRGLAYILINFFGYDEKKIKNPEQENLEYIFYNERFIYHYDGKKAHLSYEGKDISDLLLISEISIYSSILSVNKLVRSILLNYQRNFSKKFNLVTDGRDCGSVVFPDAQVKIFLTASAEIRAERWQKYMAKQGQNFSIQESIKLITERDKRDQEREIAPLIIPKDATILDNTILTGQQTLEKALNIIKKV